MSNPLKGEASVALSDGRELKMVCQFDELCAIEAELEMTLPRVLTELAECGMRAQMAALSACLKREQPEFKRSDIPAIILGKDRLAVREALSKAITGALGDVGDEVDDDAEGSAVGADEDPTLPPGTGEEP